jgi:hypothetical protein
MTVPPPPPMVPTSLPVPPGPGAQAPFAAPPTDGNRRRLGIGLAIGGVVLVLCCAGSVFGIRTLVTTSVQAAKNQAVKTVTAYLGHWEHREYDKAYDLLCDARQQDESLADFTARLAADPLDGYTVGLAEIDANAVRVNTTLDIAATGPEPRAYEVITQATQTGSICGEG